LLRWLLRWLLGWLLRWLLAQGEVKAEAVEGSASDLCARFQAP
jgi:hypothetical protein